MSDRTRPSLGVPDTEGRPEVNLFDRVYVVGSITRSVQTRLETMETEIGEAKDADAEFAVIADRFDLLLTPANGQRTPASKLLLENWQADKLAAPAVAAFFEEVLDLAAERPT